jgi:hypothetical protein
MAPTAVYEPSSQTDISDLKSKIVNGHVELERDAPPPVADNFMYDFKYNHSLPTIESLGVEVSPDVNTNEVAESLAAELAGVWSSGNAAGFTDMFLDYGELRLLRCITDEKVYGETSLSLRGITAHSTSRRTLSEPPTTCSLRRGPKT